MHVLLLLLHELSIIVITQHQSLQARCQPGRATAALKAWWRFSPWWHAASTIANCSCAFHSPVLASATSGLTQQRGLLKRHLSLPTPHYPVLGQVTL